MEVLTAEDKKADLKTNGGKDNSWVVYFGTWWTGRKKHVMQSGCRGWLCLPAMPQATGLGKEFMGSLSTLSCSKQTEICQGSATFPQAH